MNLVGDVLGDITQRHPKRKRAPEFAAGEIVEVDWCGDWYLAIILQVTRSPEKSVYDVLHYGAALFELTTRMIEL